MQRVVLIGNDEILLKTRAAVLKSTGARVVQSLPKRLEELRGGEPFDLAVLCHSIPDRARGPLSSTVRSLWPGIKVLQVQGLAFRSSASHADGVSEAIPQELIAHARQLLAR